MRILRADDYRSMPWKNGGGVTTEIAVSPADASLDSFDWRVSMANVASDGPFSLFAGIDRTLSVLEGEGIRLAIDGQEPLTLDRRSPPLSFPADRAISGMLVAGPIIDLNVMTRRTRMRHQVERASVNAAFDFSAEGGIGMILCHEGGIEIDGSSIGPGETLWLVANDGPLCVIPRPSATVFLIRIHDEDATN
ncbi:HutD/Ves family protein [Manganibacter manganicus]|uniref:HutD-family protein n=1 Tax=Manganibacter manganicus TaxID=1873176 RepID=A0A1V8RRX1_9HYPH|nr:HutD family protein [Pseudaminobacter manganicus]OQM75905.1 HutD-family protein [Pseudaminobacter manganicus]